MLTPEDIRNPARKSGFDFVATHPTWRTSAGDRFRAQYQKIKPHWYGPTRATAEEAAQDYCDYVNGTGATLAIRPSLKSAGHQRPRARRIKRSEEEIHALGVLRDARARRKGAQGYVYLMGEEGLRYAVKVGFSTSPPKRVPELQTGNPRPLELLGYFPGTEADEKALHAKYAEDNILQEWFRPSLALLSEFPTPAAVRLAA